MEYCSVSLVILVSKASLLSSNANFWRKEEIEGTLFLREMHIRNNTIIQSFLYICNITILLCTYRNNSSMYLIMLLKYD